MATRDQVPWIELDPWPEAEDWTPYRARIWRDAPFRRFPVVFEVQDDADLCMTLDAARQLRDQFDAAIRVAEGDDDGG